MLYSPVSKCYVNGFYDLYMKFIQELCVFTKWTKGYYFKEERVSVHVMICISVVMMSGRMWSDSDFIFCVGSGAQGEYAGLRAIMAYLHANGEDTRTVSIGLFWYHAWIISQVFDLVKILNMVRS